MCGRSGRVPSPRWGEGQGEGGRAIERSIPPHPSPHPSGASGETEIDCRADTISRARARGYAPTCPLERRGGVVHSPRPGSTLARLADPPRLGEGEALASRPHLPLQGRPEVTRPTCLSATLAYEGVMAIRGLNSAIGRAAGTADPAAALILGLLLLIRP